MFSGKRVYQTYREWTFVNNDTTSIHWIISIQFAADIMLLGIDGSSKKSSPAIAGAVVEAYVRDVVLWQWFTDVSQYRISFKQSKASGGDTGQL